MNKKSVPCSVPSIEILKQIYSTLNYLKKSAIILMFGSIKLINIDILKKKGVDKNIRIKKYMF